MSKLSESFKIDPGASAVVKHNREVREVWKAFKADKPIRIPVIFTGARSVYSDENKVDYRAFYNDPDEMVLLQLQWKKRERELPFGDTVLGELPEKWKVNLDFHPVLVSSCFGCEVIFRPDAVPVHQGLNLSKEQCQSLVLPDLEASGLFPQYLKFWEHVNRRYAGDFRFMGRPVDRVSCALNLTYPGIFSLALDIRGGEVMADMYDDAEFVNTFLRRLADWQIDLARHWTLRNGSEFGLDQPGGKGFGPTDHGIDMLSVKMYKTFLVPLIQDLNARFKKTPNPFLHHCGRGAHLFPVIKKHFGFEELHAITYPLNDVGRIRKELGYETWITAGIADAIIFQGPPDKIRQTVRDFLTPDVKGKGRLSIWIAGEARHIPSEHYLALYEAVKEYGRY